MLACMKGFSGLGAFLILLVGLAMTGITIYGFANSQIFLDDTSKRNSILGVMIAADILIVFGAIIGIWGLKKGNALLICVFQVLVIVFLIVFFSLGIAAEVLPSQFFSGGCDAPDNPTVKLALSVSSKAQLGFCTKVPVFGCPCSLTEDTVSKYNITEKGVLNLFYTNRQPIGGANAFHDCYPPGSIASLTDEQRNMGRALGAIEEMFECAGWCDDSSNNLFYRFSGVNNWKPKANYCYNQLRDKVNEYGHVVGLGALFTAGFLLLVCIINTCICCHPSRKGLKFKDRFVYMKDGAYQRI